MSESKVISRNTPGPWEFLGDSDYDECRVRQTESVQHGRDYSSEITICENIRKKADASLIAAAPDLLEALEDLMRIVDNSGDEQYVTIQLTPEFFEPARSAIARARGLSQ